jgi:hypothetical protein
MSSAPAAEQALRPGSARRNEGIGPAVRIEPTRLLPVFSGLTTSGLCSSGTADTVTLPILTERFSRRSRSRLGRPYRSCEKLALPKGMTSIGGQTSPA